MREIDAKSVLIVMALIAKSPLRLTLQARKLFCW
jgi:hypothetical protein